jgi:D-proline reductase (dithiol) PrdB
MMLKVAMALTVIKGLQSEIFVPDVPPAVWTPVTKPLETMRIALVTACGVHMRSQERFIVSGDSSYREIPGDVKSEHLMVTHGGYDNSDANKDINCMFPIDRLRELAASTGHHHHAWHHCAAALYLWSAFVRREA